MIFPHSSYRMMLVTVRQWAQIAHFFIGSGPSPGALGRMAHFSPEIEELVRGLAEKIVASEGMDFVELELRPRGQRWLIRVFIDQEGGVTTEDCATVSRQLGAVLDVEDLIPQQYTLEVSSPGLDRPLRTARDFRRNTGRLVRLTLRNRDGEEECLQGRIQGCGPDGLLLRPETGPRMEIPLERIRKAKLLIDWDKPQTRKGDRNR